MSDNPPAAADAPIIAKMAKLGIKSAAPFDFALLDPVASSNRESIHLHAPPLVADGKIAVHPQRYLGDSGCEESEVIAR